MQIRLWTSSAFSKKVNSTKKPTGGTVVEGYFRNSDTFSMYSPRIRIDFSTCRIKRRLPCPLTTIA